MIRARTEGKTGREGHLARPGGQPKAWSEQQGQDLTTLNADNTLAQCERTGVLVTLSWL